MKADRIKAKKTRKIRDALFSIEDAVLVGIIVCASAEKNIKNKIELAG